MDRTTTPPRIPARPTDANKVTVGRVLVVGGSVAMAGAPAMAGLGALRAGAGLVKIAVPGRIQATVAAFRPETTTLGLPQNRHGGLGSAAQPILKDVAPDWDCVVLGPGMGRTASTLQLVRTFTQDVKRPLVLDADALFAFGGKLEMIHARSTTTVLTPHEGEAARLLGTTSDDVRADREDAAVRLAAATGAVVVLKGPRTLVTDGTRMFENTTGGPALATGGSGDVLAGVIAALLASGLDAFDAASAGAYVHGLAADHVADQRDRGLLATELAGGIPDALLALREDAE